jgi:hypothetical protein
VNKEILLSILYPGKDCENAFDIAIKKNLIKVIDGYIKILIQLDEVKHYRFSKQIRKYFKVILEMNIASFMEYLNLCTFK